MPQKKVKYTITILLNFAIFAIFPQWQTILENYVEDSGNLSYVKGKVLKFNQVWR